MDQTIHPFPLHNHHQSLMPTPRRNYVCMYIISQYPDHPALFFLADLFSLQALMTGFRIRGVFRMEYPRVLGRAINMDS